MNTFLKKSKAYQIFCQTVPNKKYRLLIYIGIWTLLAGFAALKRNYLYPHSLPLPWNEAIQNKLAIWYLWGSTVLVIIWLASSLRVTRNNWKKNGAALIALSIVVTLSFLCIWSGYFHITYASTTEWGHFTNRFSYALGHHSTFYFLFFWFVVGLEHASALHLKTVEKAVEGKELKVQLAQAQFQNLKNQLQPHFIFNTMNMISNMIDTEPNLARETLVKLGQLLRSSIDLTKLEETTLEKEIEFTSAFLDLQKARFDGRFKTKVSIPDDIKTALVPSLTVQPLVENVIKHAVEMQDKTVRVTICASHDLDSLRLQVEDDGPGLNKNAKNSNGHGIGLSNLENRLRMLHGDAANIELSPSDYGGVLATVIVPLRYHNGAKDQLTSK